MFASAPTKPQTPFSFGASGIPPMSPAPPWTAQQQSRPGPLTPQQRIQAIADAYNPNSPDCRFRHMMFNRVDPADVDKYVRPATVNERLWTQAVEANPDPSRFVPVQATGFQDLRLRVEEQNKITTEHVKALEDVQAFLLTLQKKHDLDTRIKIDQYKQRHLELSHRVLKLMKRVEVLTYKGYPISLEEEAFRAKLENLQRELNQPSLFRGRLSDLLSFLRTHNQQEVSTASNIHQQLTDTLDHDSLESIHTFLEQQTAGLAHLAELLKQDLRDMTLSQEMLCNDKNDRVGKLS